MIELTRSLSTRMIIVFGGLLAGMGAFMIAFFPRGMAEQAERSTADRAVSIAQVMSTAIAPSIEFDDSEHATQILGWLETTREARFAVLLGPEGAPFAAWHPERVPAGQRWDEQVTFGAELLVVTVPVHGRADGRGMLHVGFSLRSLSHERKRLASTISVVAALVVLIGLAATLIAAKVIVRPIRRITATAQQIARGELPPELPPLPGDDEIAHMADALRAMLERVHERSQRELMRASRHAGMAEVATGVLHNVGNVLNSVNVSVELLRERLRSTPVERLVQLREIVRAMDPVTIDAPKAAALIQFIEVLTDASVKERDLWARELEGLRNNIDHVKRVVAMQNAYARQGGVVETTSLRRLVDEALEIALPPSRRAGFEITIEVPDETVLVDRHRVMHVLVNLIANARDAHAGSDGDKRIVIRGGITDGRLQISVTDSGTGFSPDTAARLFAAGFTTKRHGHGYGLHSSALSMRQLGGELLAASDGVGKGATFTLLLPLETRAEAAS